MNTEPHKTTEKRLLYEVSLIRPFVIFLLVVMHSFTKIAEGGLRSNTYQLPEIYQWLCHLISGFRIETIALVAGYVFAYQSIDLHRKYELKSFVIKKFRRLILPMLFFGIFYYVMFLYVPETFSVSGFLLKWFSGCGHLWFLPMLFWCFMAIWLIDHFHLSSWKTLLLLAIIAVLPLPFYRLPLGFSRLPHFLFFVYGGYFLYEHRHLILNHSLNIKTALSLWVVYVFWIIIRQTALEQTPNLSFNLGAFIWKGLQNSVDLLISCIGILALYTSISIKTIHSSFIPPQWVIRSSDYCYGVYVFHQFILVYLYHYTPIVSKINSHIIPWLGLTIALLASWCLTNLFLRTRFGRYLIG